MHALKLYPDLFIDQFMSRSIGADRTYFCNITRDVVIGHKLICPFEKFHYDVYILYCISFVSFKKAKWHTTDELDSHIFHNVVFPT